jgi:RHS repeat-associated protein
VATPTGTILERHTYTPYGQRTVRDANWNVQANTTLANNVGHQGLTQDAETGLYYNRARYFHSTLGLFTQRDPLGYVDGGSLVEYEGGRPVGLVDPSGLLTQCNLLRDCRRKQLAKFKDHVTNCRKGYEKAYTTDTIQEVEQQYEKEYHDCNRRLGELANIMAVTLALISRGGIGSFVVPGSDHVKVLMPRNSHLINISLTSANSGTIWSTDTTLSSGKGAYSTPLHSGLFLKLYTDSNGDERAAIVSKTWSITHGGDYLAYVFASSSCFMNNANHAESYLGFTVSDATANQALADCKKSLG